jgi:transaldolase
MTMRLLLDSANISDIRELSRTSVIAGVTTNPSLIAKEANDGRPYSEVLKEIWGIIASGAEDPPHFSFEVTTLDPHGMYLQATELRYKILNDVGRRTPYHIKIPVSPETMWVITALSKAGFPVNATACMTALQAKLASDAGASIVSFFYARMKDYIKKIEGYRSDQKALDTEAAEDARAEISLYRSWCDQGRASAKIIAGSIRTPHDVMDCWTAGAHYVTTSKKVISECLEHPKTRESIEGFQRDIDAWLA